MNIRNEESEEKLLEITLSIKQVDLCVILKILE